MIKNWPVNYNIAWFISKSHEILYLPILKSASSSIKMYMKKKVSGEEILPSKENELCVQNFQDYFSFSFVRHPIDRLFSCYKNKILQPNILDKNTGVGTIFSKYGTKFYKEMSFKDFLKVIISIDPENYDNHFRPQHEFLYDSNKQLAIDYVGKFENINNDFSYILNKINLPKEELPILNKTNYKESYDEEAIDIAKKVYGVKKDMEIFNY